MSTLWGKNKTDDSQAGESSDPWHPGNGDGGQGDSSSAPPTERTRLLPNRTDERPPLLNPDDPAVSPYNLWTVRIVRYATVLFAALTFVWWVLLLVSIFVTPPGLYTRGSPFFAFGYACLALFNICFTLAFFAVPSRAVRILSIVMAVLLFVDVIITVSVERTRHEERWVGMTSVIWALAMSLWTLLADRTVKWGKAEEEERLTGRVETRRTVFEWTEVLVSTIAFVVLTIVIVLMTTKLILRALDAGVAPPGKRYWVDGGKYQIHLSCHGDANTTTNAKGGKEPTVLLEGGEWPVEDGLWQLADNAVQNGSISRYCFADRPGYAWSDTGPSPLSAGMATDALSEALARAGETGPWVLLSAGTGAHYSRVFSARHGEEVKGILLVDPEHEDLLGRIASPWRGFELWLRGVISPLGLEQLPGALFHGRGGKDRVWGRSAGGEGKLIFAWLQEGLVADSLTRRDVESARAIQREDTPVTVISSGVKMRRDRRWEDKQRGLTHLTRNTQHWDVVDEAPHRVWETYEGRKKIEKRLRQLVRA
ncbi:mitochondrial integral membrane protein [Sodiomyces alkalinus F11]|uniref:Mitochondrial integral membrane protein n=1 Tax=Sodiomyces alkalinus (strain CBS 110278 / VKM F-3762 / F11) TaxID=1314773 RepID=A0A3N2PQN6_SODAK|nr:mitochondrial integral membrane protein [Sodiomyces alkalinus F11]ROT36770.1 mitochondrial integral membrane protein [Sodiomyces alkalinus F11]